MSHILDEPLATIAAALRRGESSAEELATLAIERHARLGDRLDAYQTWDPENALAQARAVDDARRAGFPLGPLGGMPVSVKDLFGVDGYPTYAGTAKRLPAEWEREGFLVETLRRQLAVVIGKTRQVELAFGGLGINPHWGTPVNPWDAATDRVPGGSSCGAGVSLWEGSAVVALGTDTACSIRTPASWTGTVGHKPTYGRWPTDGLVPLSPTLDTVGGLTRSVQDAAYFFASIDPLHGDPQRFLTTLGHTELSEVRIGVGGTSVWDECQDDIVEPVRAALRELESHGARLVEIELPEFDAASELYATGVIAGPQCAAFLEDRLPDWMDTLHETVGERVRGAANVTAREHLRALARRRALKASAEERLRAVDVLATPMVPITPPTHAQVERLEDYVRLNRLTFRAASPVNVLDLCAVTFPCGLDAARMPVGLQLIARNGEDERLLAAALAAERVLGSAIERIGAPPLVA